MFSISPSQPAATPRRERGLRLALAAALSLAATFAGAQTVPLTLEQALQLATQASSSNRAAQAAIEASGMAAARANQLPDPMLKLGIDNLPLSGQDKFSATADSMTMRRLGIEQQWVSADKRQARQERAKRAVAMEEGAYLENVGKVREEAGKAWLTLLYAQRASRLYGQLEQAMADDVAAAQAAHRGAKATAAEVLQAQMELAQGRDDSRRAAQEVASARIALARWVRTPFDAVADAPPAMSAHLPTIPTADLEHYHAGVLNARRAIDLADADTAVALRERHPDWSFEAVFNQRGSQYGNMLSFGVSIPLTVNRGQRQDRDVAEKSALGTKARLQYEDTLLEMRSQIEQMSLELDSLRERTAQLNATLLPAAQQQVELSVAAYRGGAGTLSAVFKARRTLLEKQLQINELDKQCALTWARLELHVIPHDMANQPRTAQ
ncbi:TolC family protein [Rugamonas sp. CCM 8940]|uniref:TolC family protein n=1 Tax=Rugamonas sp. CCM 8940 TaxID=2765359 RepID=UPI0018F59607|nr:TolC family protein [Rugamonas sp. CCM 8940]MBJ7312983.1 TolC family protein [Rugamonas sp. CCM 8940]